MYARMINEHEIETAIPRTAVVDGALIGNVASKPEILNQLGFWPLVETERPKGDYRAVYAFDGAHIVRGWEESPPPLVRVYQLSKIAIRKWMEARGLGETFAGILSANPGTAQDWADAVTLDDDDPAVLAMMAHMVGAGLLTEDDVADLKVSCRSVYQPHGLE